MTLRDSARSGSYWTILNFTLSQLFRLGANIALAAILYQEAFALMAVATAVIQGLAMCSDLGLAPCVIQHKRGDDRDFLDTAWTIQLVRGALLSLIALALALPAAYFYGQNDPAAHDLKWLLPLLAISNFVTSLQSARIMTASRHMNLARTTILSLSTQAFGLVITISLAWLTRSVYALAVGTICSAAIHSLLSHLVIPGQRARIRWDPSAAHDIIHFGKWIIVSTLTTFFASQLDKLVFAKAFPLHEVGVYTIAAGLAGMAPMLIGGLQMTIAFPMFSRILERGGDLSSSMSTVKPIMLTLAGIIVALMIAGARPFADLVYDDRYRAVADFIPPLAIGSLFAAIESIYGTAFLAKGKAQWVASMQIAKVVFLCLAMIPTIPLGIKWAVIAVAAADAAKALVSILLARNIGLRNQYLDAFYVTYTVAIGYGVAWIAGHTGMKDWPILLILATETALVGIAFSPMIISARQAISTTQRGGLATLNSETPLIK